MDWWNGKRQEAVEMCKGAKVDVGGRVDRGEAKGRGRGGVVKIFLRCGENVIRTRDYVSRIQKFHFAR